MKKIEYRLVDFGDALSVASVSVTPREVGEDASAEIQRAIDFCAENGGGTVYLEAGEYVLCTPLTIRSAVILCGCSDPTKEQDEVTTLLCRHGQNDPDGEAQISMAACSGLKNLRISYPDQCLEQPVPYAVTVRQCGVDSMTVENVVMVNPWRGIQCGPDGNELHFIKNVYITPLDIGFYIDMTTDIGRIQGLHITPDCYAKHIPGADIEQVRTYMLAHTTGLFMARSDWEYVYDFSAEYCRAGIKITAVKDSGPNAQLSSVKLCNCKVGVQLIDVNPYGIALSDSVIRADIAGLEAAVKTEESFETIIQLNGVDFENHGGYKTVIQHSGSGQLSFTDCTINGWAQDGFAVSCDNGGISFIQCTFHGAGADFDFGGRISGAQILGCTFDSSAPEIVYNGKTTAAAASDWMQYTAESSNFPKASRGGHKPYPYAIGPAQKKLFPVEDYGALRNSDKDSSAAIQAALDAASSAGGGIVYLPGGQYICDAPIHIPTGVELRGVAEVPCHTMGGGSVIMSKYGRGDENAEPLVIMAEHSGIVGVLFYNLEQDAADPVPYPFAVQSRGKYCYVVNTVFVNMWQSLDMASYPSEGHYVSYIAGAPFKVGVYLGSNEGEGWVENIQFNPHYWFRSQLPNAPHSRNWQPFWFNQMKYLEALKFGYNACEHLLGTFVFAAQHGIGFVRQNGRGTSGKFIGHGTDSGLIALYLEGAERIEMVNTQLVNIQAEGRRSYIYSAPEEVGGKTGEYRLYNTLMWGDPHYAAIFDGGEILVEQMNIVNPGKTAITVNGGDVKLCSVYFKQSPVKCEINGGKAEFYAPVASGKGREDIVRFYDIAVNGGETQVKYEVVKQ